MLGMEVRQRSRDLHPGAFWQNAAGKMQLVLFGACRIVLCGKLTLLHNLRTACADSAVFCVEATGLCWADYRRKEKSIWD